MGKVTLREFEGVTDKHPKFLKELLQAVPFTREANRAYLYDSTQALPAIYAGAKSLEEARTRVRRAAQTSDHAPEFLKRGSHAGEGNPKRRRPDEAQNDLQLTVAMAATKYWLRT